MDSFDYMRKSRAISRGDNETDRKGNAWDQVPAESNFFRADKFLLKGETAKSDQITEEVESPTDCTIRQRIECASDALKLLRNRFKSDREYLIWVARFFLQLKFEKMDKIFRLHSSNLCRISKKADSRLYKNNTEGKAKIKSPRETT